MHPVILPILDANMTHGVIRAWLKNEGESVQAGEALFEVETDKVNAEVEAEVSGIVRRIVADVGQRVAVLDVVAFIGGAHEALTASTSCGDATVTPSVGAEPAADGPPVLAASMDVERSQAPAAAAPRRPAASPAARRLARQHGIALEDLRGSGARGEITAADVEAACGAIAVGAAADGGRLEPAFLEELRRDAEAFRRLSSELKVRAYREHGARIGDRACFDDGAIVLAQQLELGDGVRIGADSTIDCETVRLGALAAFGRRTRAHCRSIEIGAALWAKDDVVIGGGGSDEEGARLRAGDACFFGEGAYINPCHPITLGDEVCIGSRAMLFTHSHWQSVLRGYHSLFGPIRIGNHVFIGNQAFVFPGVTIGDGATVIVNSFVAVNVPAETMVGGVPAQVMRHINAPAPAEQRALIADQLMPELARVLSRRSGALPQRRVEQMVELDLGGPGLVRFVAEWSQAAPTSRRLVVLTFAVPPNISPPAGLTVFDLAAGRVHGEQDALSDEVREVCRRRGIRFRPYAWRYGVGHFDGEHMHWRSKVPGKAPLSS